jgi:hypothetical protein
MFVTNLQGGYKNGDTVLSVYQLYLVYLLYQLYHVYLLYQLYLVYLLYLVYHVYLLYLFHKMIQLHCTGVRIKQKGTRSLRVPFVRPPGCFSNHFMDDLRKLSALSV